MDGILDQDVSQITFRVSARTGLVLAGSLAIIAVVVYVVLMQALA
jgi:hypothetical protein